MKESYWSAIKSRRSFYDIDKNINLSDEKIKEILNQTALHVPSAYNSQTARLVLLLNENHDKLWDIIMEALKKIVPAEKFPTTEKKIESFKKGYGTVLFFEDNDVVAGLQKKFPLYKENFAVWSQQSSGMHQYVVWTALCSEGLGASLQHYNELIESDVKKEWGFPNGWSLIAQMPFGNPVTLPEEKEIKPLEDRVFFK